VDRSTSKELEAAVAAVPSVPEGDRDGAAAVGDLVLPLLSRLQRQHALETTGLWPVLLERVDPADVLAVRLMKSQRTGVSALTERAARALSTWLGSASSASATDLIAALTRLGDALDQHAAAAESTLAPLVDRHLTTDERAALDRGAD